MRQTAATVTGISLVSQPHVSEPAFRYDLREAARMPERLLRLPEVIRRTGMCRAKVYRLDGFPKPIKIGGRSSAWIESEVDAWIASVVAEARKERALPRNVA